MIHSAMGPQYLAQSLQTNKITSRQPSTLLKLLELPLPIFSKLLKPTTSVQKLRDPTDNLPNSPTFNKINYNKLMYLAILPSKVLLCYNLGITGSINCQFVLARVASAASAEPASQTWQIFWNMIKSVIVRAVKDPSLIDCY